MIPLFAAAPPAPKLGAQVAAVRLYKGADVALAPGLPRYFDVSEAVLDSKEGDTPQPLEYAAAVGPQRSLLLRFGSLDAVIPAGAIVRSATLKLSSADSQPIKIRSVRRALLPWKGAGPTVLSSRLRKDQVAKPRQAATWNARRLGQKWSRGGAASDLDSAAIEGVAITEDGTITGLAATVQNMANRWWENQGMLLQFETEALLGSSLSPMGRPELTVEYEMPPQVTDGTDLAAVGRAGDAVAVANLGAAPSKAYRVRANVDGKAGEWSPPQPPLGPGATADVALAKPLAGATGMRVVLEVEGLDANPHNDAVEIFVGGKEVAAPSAGRAFAVARAVRLWNAAAEASRYGFAPEGPSARLTYTGVGASSLPDEGTAAVFPALSSVAGIPESASVNLDASKMPRLPGAPSRGAADRFPGLSGGGDSRGEAALPAQTTLPNEPYDDPLLRRLALEGGGGLSLFDVAALEAGGPPPLPGAALALILNASGRPLSDLSVTVFAGDAAGFEETPVATLKTSAGGTVLLSGKLLGPKLLAIVATANGQTEVAFIKDTQLRAAAVRGNSAPIIPVRLNLPTLPVRRDGSLASGKFITDSLGTPANVLGLAVDGNAATALSATYPANGWVEIDLGRDRTLAEVALRAESLPRRFDVRLRGTGEEASASGLWATEGDYAWTRANRPDSVAGGTGVLYRGTAQRGRYLRIVFPDGGTISLGELLAYAADTGG